MVVESVLSALTRRKWKSYHATRTDVGIAAEGGLQRAQFHIHTVEENDAFQRAKKP